MAIRSACKAIVYHNGKILLNSHRFEDGSVCYDFPGGGQHPYESLEEGVLREVKEETGYEVRIERFCGLTEEIHMDEERRKSAPDYTHRVLHIFLVTLANEQRGEITELDQNQTGSIWVPVEEVANLPLRPAGIAPHIRPMVEAEHPVYLPAFYV